MNIDDLLDRAVAAAHLSPNSARKVGAIVLAAAGGTEIAACNTFPNGVRDIQERHLGTGRLIWMEHAERNAIYQAARSGVSTERGTILSTFFPCADCARAIVQSGIIQLYTLAADFSDPVWGDSFRYSSVILAEGGVEVIILDHDAAQMHARTLGAT